MCITYMSQMNDVGIWIVSLYFALQFLNNVCISDQTGRFVYLHLFTISSHKKENEQI